MNIFGIHIITSGNLATLKAAAQSVGTAGSAGLTAAVARSSEAGNPIGIAARDAIALAEGTGHSGPDKKAQAVEIVAQAVMSEVARGGLQAAITDAETFAGLVVEQVLASMKRTSVVSIGLALLKLLGVSVTVK